MLHLGNAGQLSLQPLLLLGEREARCCVQLLEAPPSLSVELQQVGVVLPGGGEERFKELVSSSNLNLLYYHYFSGQNVLNCCFKA